MYEREQLYKRYVCKSLQLNPKGGYLTQSYEDFLKPQKMDTRSGDEIAQDIIKRAGLIVEGGESL